MIQKEPATRLVLLGAALILLLVHQQTINVNATLPEVQRFLPRRQTGDKETELVATSGRQGQREQNGSGSGRLYPDLPRAPNGGAFAPFANAPTPFVPFGIQMPPNGLNPQVRLPQQPRSMTPAERQESQAFSNGLGKRLLSMIGIKPSNETESAGLADGPDGQANVRSVGDDPMKALQNSTVVQQLNRGVHSVYDNLAKMYNSTVQQQLQLLQERFKKETENTTNPWQERMAQQVPMFFKSMAKKVEDAQANLNRVLQQVMRVQNESASQNSNAPPASQTQKLQSRSMFDPYMGDDGTYYDGPPSRQPNFFQQIGHSLGFGQDDYTNMMNNGRQDGLGGVLMNFWHNRVLPQIGMIRGQVMRTWSDLTNSGAFSPQMMIQSRQSANNLGSSPENSSSEIVDDILKNVDMSGPEYTLVEPNSDSTKLNIAPQIQNGIMSMQRDINQLWMGLTRSLQGAIGNVKRALNQRPGMAPMEPLATDNVNPSDPEENEINGKIKDLSKLQREADTVYDVVRNQQDAQQRQQGFGDRFRNFFNNMDLSGVEQLPDRIGSSFSRFGTAVNDLWHQVPERWDNFVHNNVRNGQDNMMNNRLVVQKSTGSSSTTQKPAS